MHRMLRHMSDRMWRLARCHVTWRRQPSGKPLRSQYRARCTLLTFLGPPPASRKPHNDHMPGRSHNTLRCMIGIAGEAWLSPFMMKPRALPFFTHAAWRCSSSSLVYAQSKERLLVLPWSMQSKAHAILNRARWVNDRFAATVVLLPKRNSEAERYAAHSKQMLYFLLEIVNSASHGLPMTERLHAPASFVFKQHQQLYRETPWNMTNL